MSRTHLLTQLDQISDNRVTGLGIEFQPDKPSNPLNTTSKPKHPAAGSSSIADRRRMFESFGEAPAFNIKLKPSRTGTLNPIGGGNTFSKSLRTKENISDRHDEPFGKVKTFESRRTIDPTPTKNNEKSLATEFKMETVGTSTPKKNQIKNKRNGNERDIIDTKKDNKSKNQSKPPRSGNNHNQIIDGQQSRTGQSKKTSIQVQNSILSLIDSFSDPHEPMSQFINPEPEIQLSPYGFLYSDILDNDDVDDDDNDEVLDAHNSLSDCDNNSGYTTNTSIFTLSPKRHRSVRRDMSAELRLGGLRLENMLNMVLCIEACVEAENEMILMELEGFTLELRGSVGYNTTVVGLHI